MVVGPLNKIDDAKFYLPLNQEMIHGDRRILAPPLTAQMVKKQKCHAKVPTKYNRQGSKRNVLMLNEGNIEAIVDKANEWFQLHPRKARRCLNRVTKLGHLEASDSCEGTF